MNKILFICLYIYSRPKFPSPKKERKKKAFVSYHQHNITNQLDVGHYPQKEATILFQVKKSLYLYGLLTTL